MTDQLLEVDGLSIAYETKGRDVNAVTNANFTIDNEEYFGLIGESGCGKSTMAKAIMGTLDSNGTIKGGNIRYKGTELSELSESEIRSQIRWKEIAMIPQASMNSLDPIQKISDQAIEIADIHTQWSKEETINRLSELFNIVGISENRIYDYPFEFSGGMQQRAVIALSLLLKPSLIIADEPTTALDVIMQDQIFRHLQNVKEEENVSILLITHDIAVIFENCDSTAVMHGGQVAEYGKIEDIQHTPKHPYTYLLQKSFPDIRYPDKELKIIEGSPPDLRGDVDYCTFVDRCPWATEDCRTEAPPLLDANGDRTHFHSCLRESEIEMEKEE